MSVLNVPHELPELFASGATASPNKTALVHEGATRTFGELDWRIGLLAGALRDAGVDAGDRVALLAFNEMEFFELQAGCQRIGATFVPLNFRLAPPEIVELLKDAAPQVVVHGPGLADNLPSDGELDVWHLGPEGRGKSYEAQLRAAERVGPADHGLDPDRLAHLLYTSGTTGRAKGAMITNRAHAYRVAIIERGLQPRASDVFLQAGPLFHLTSTISFASIVAGGTHVSSRGFDPTAWFSLIEAHRVTKGFLAPTMIAALVDAASGPLADSFELVIYGASCITAGLLGDARRTFGCEFVQMYGMTETGAATILSPEDHHDDDSPRLSSAGRAVPGIDIQVRDNENRLARPGKFGEIVIRSPAVMRGYWSDERGSREALRNDWMHTGDAGYMDADGYLFITDRIKDIIITGGENVSCPEVEYVLATHTSVSDVAVIGLPDERWGQRVHAIVVSAPDAELDEAALDDWCRQRLAGYKRPRSYESVESLPQNAMGKLLKHVLRQERSA